MTGPTGFQMRPETVDRYLNIFGELPEGINLQDSRIFPESGLLEMRYVVLDSIYDIESVADESCCCRTPILPACSGAHLLRIQVTQAMNPLVQRRHYCLRRGQPVAQA